MVREVGNWSEWLKIEDSDGVEDIIRRHTRTGRPLGSTAFLVGIEERLGRRLLPKKRGPRMRKSAQDRGNDQSEPPTSVSLFG
jgi:putative transposase